MKRSIFSQHRLIFLAIVVLAFSLRSLYFNQTVKYLVPGTGSDGYFYLEWAKDIVRGNVLGKEVFYALPLYPYFLSLAYLFSGGEIFGLILIQMLLGSINCGLIYFLARKLFNLQVGIIAGIFACAYLLFIFYDRMFLPSTLAIFLGLVLALLLLKAKDNPNIPIWSSVGFLLGLCTLASASFSLLVIFIFFWIIFLFRKDSLRKLVLYCMSFILPFLLIIASVTLRNYLVAKDPVLITAHSGINFYIGNSPQANGLFKVPPYMRPTQSGLIKDAHIVAEKISAKRLKASEVSRFWFRRSLSFITTQPLDYLRLLGKKFVLYWNGREYVDDIEYYMFNEETGPFKLALLHFSFILPLALLGISISWPKRTKLFPLYSFVFAFSLGTILFFINSRYRLMVVPFLIIFAACGLGQLLQQYQHRQYRNLVFLLIFFFTLCLLTNTKVTDASHPHDFTFYYNKAVFLSDRADFSAAQKEFQAALELNPYDFMSYLGLGNTYYKTGDSAKAIDCYKIALAINPFYYDAHFNLGLTYEEIGQKEEAEREFKQVLELKPDDCAAHYNLGIIYQEKGLIDLAWKEYQQALKIQPDHPEILQALEEIKQNN